MTAAARSNRDRCSSVGEKMEELGAGALLPTSMDRDGGQEGYDLPMLRAVTEAVQDPGDCLGGAGGWRICMQPLLRRGEPRVLVASMVHLGNIQSGR